MHGSYSYLLIYYGKEESLVYREIQNHSPVLKARPLAQEHKIELPREIVNYSSIANCSAIVKLDSSYTFTNHQLVRPCIIKTLSKLLRLLFGDISTVLAQSIKRRSAAPPLRVSWAVGPIYTLL